jgi:ankyrin repeat protein
MGKASEAFHDAVERNDLGAVAAMLGRDAQHSRLRDDEGKSPLHKAAGRGLVAMVTQLLGAGAGEAVNSKDASGNTPLHDAVASGCVETARILVQNGALADVVNKGGDTPRDIAFDEAMMQALRPDSGALEVPACFLARARFEARARLAKLF